MMATMMIAVVAIVMVTVVVVMPAVGAPWRVIFQRHHVRPGNGRSGLVHHWMAERGSWITHVHLCKGTEALRISGRLHLARRMPRKTSTPKQLPHLCPHDQ